MTYHRKLIEVALPLEAINVASAREKGIRHGHPSTLHLWWARRPLATCRAVLFASLVDDPSANPDLFTDLEGGPERIQSSAPALIALMRKSHDPHPARVRNDQAAHCREWAPRGATAHGLPGVCAQLGATSIGDCTSSPLRKDIHGHHQ